MRRHPKQLAENTVGDALHIHQKEHHLMKRLAMTLIATVALVLGVGSVQESPAQAAPQLPRFSPYGEVLGTFGDHAYCRGVLNVGLTPTPGKRGWVRLTLVSTGFTGSGPGWTRNPRCQVLILVTTTSIRGYHLERFFRTSFGPRPGQRFTRDVNTGSGLANVNLTTYSIHGPIRNPQSFGTSHYLVVP